MPLMWGQPIWLGLHRTAPTNWRADGAEPFPASHPLPPPQLPAPLLPRGCVGHISKTQILNCQNYFLQENRFISLQHAGSLPHFPLAPAPAHAGAYPMPLRSTGTLACSSGPLSDFEKWIIDYNSTGLSADLSGECIKARAWEKRVLLANTSIACTLRAQLGKSHPEHDSV